MKKTKLTLLFVIIIFCFETIAQDVDYIEFNDRKNILHGIYLGVDAGYGKIDDNIEGVLIGTKLAYVANKKMELGVALRGFASRNAINTTFNIVDELFVVYGGFHVENILFSESKVKVSFPALMGIGYIQGSGALTKNEDMMLVLEPGVNILYNINKFIQLETGIKYRFSSPIDLIPSDVVNNINGISFGIGIKMGVFNLGENRYKKNPPKE
ncbi:hypothetical protein [Aquimarina litoralis]|uniref:hypothetical protein n=1 Tax=Aquimarina litoralis TaxID=584605 RepID=UPI001C59CED5|nr:hypothetical protein [Aquimarina litoralis]MBW1298179.1 hypothetical protein [Aquimarina litoralis]